mmetsp:Transcript_20206/g.24526  ORF Transcript_20206/g.24526 Transcript_20206/m.24526 type:complete len:343 (+) Transcript_20206:171-1199(+)
MVFSRFLARMGRKETACFQNTLVGFQQFSKTLSSNQHFFCTRPLSTSEKILQSWVRGSSDSEQSSLADTEFSTLKIESLDDGQVVHVKFNRANTLNSLNAEMFEDLLSVYDKLEKELTARAVVLSGEGGNFSSGLDLSMFQAMQAVAASESCEGRTREGLGKIISVMQNTCSASAKCHAPVIAAVNGVCFGAGIDLITACDLVITAADSRFCVKEVDLAIVADLGTLQRLPKLVNHQVARELAYTGRVFSGREAKEIGLALEVQESNDEVVERALSLAKTIASKSPLTVRGIKRTMAADLETGVQESLDYVKLLNSAQLYSSDLQECMKSLAKKKNPKFSKY